MKRNKLLLITPCLALAPAICTVSCGGQSPAQKIANAIFGPLDLTPTSLDKSFKDALKSLNQEELNNELVYDLYMGANANNQIPELDKSIRDLYKENKVELKINITTSELKFDNDNLKASFVGYVSFIFLQDINESFKENDYIMITYDFKNIIPNINDDYLGYDGGDGYSIGFIKTRCDGGQHEHLKHIPSINKDSFEFSNIPHNSKNWVKNN